MIRLVMRIMRMSSSRSFTCFHKRFAFEQQFDYLWLTFKHRSTSFANERVKTRRQSTLGRNNLQREGQNEQICLPGDGEIKILKMRQKWMKVSGAEGGRRHKQLFRELFDLLVTVCVISVALWPLLLDRFVSILTLTLTLFRLLFARLSYLISKCVKGFEMASTLVGIILGTVFICL